MTILSGGREQSFLFQVVDSNYYAAKKGEKCIAISNAGINSPVLVSKESLRALLKVLEQTEVRAKLFLDD